jgi:adenylosuccinate synthase
LIGDSTLDWRPLFDQLVAYGQRMKPWVRDVSLFLARAAADRRPILFEGAQGTLLDIDHGTYPFVTSSNASIGGVCTGLGVGPRMIDAVLGVVKAYSTRVGEGPLPTELRGDSGNQLRESGLEYGAVTGRPRRCGWYDAVVVRYAARINGLDAVALTKLDVLDGLDAIQVCTGYRHGNQTLTEWPVDLGLLAACEPVYETLPGWSRPTRGLTRYDDLPREAQRYVTRLEEVSGVPVSIVSTGSGRADTIIREGSLAASWVGQRAVGAGDQPV